MPKVTIIPHLMSNPESTPTHLPCQTRLYRPSQGLWIWYQEVFNTVPYAGRYDSSHPPSGVALAPALSSQPGYRKLNIKFSFLKVFRVTLSPKKVVFGNKYSCIQCIG
jgi:hypothetical protein